MKKLIIIAACACTAAIAQAAAISWTAGTMTLAGGGGLTAKGDITGYLFMIDEGAYQSYIDNGYTATGAKLSEKLWADFGSSLDSADAKKEAFKNGNLASIQVMDGDVAKDYAVGTYYAALIMVDKVTEGDYVMGNIGKISVEGALDVTRSGLGATIFGDGAVAPTVATGWYSAAPEPTSGILLLLGIAGLALKRKRA